VGKGGNPIYGKNNILHTSFGCMVNCAQNNVKSLVWIPLLALQCFTTREISRFLMLWFVV